MMLEISSKDPDAMSDALTPSDMVRDMILAERDDAGLARATEVVARACQITYRRARAIWNNEARRLWDDEAARIRKAYVASMKRELQQLDHQQALIRARLDALRSDHEKIDGTLRGLEVASLHGAEQLGTSPR
jgi:hypothetical protein